MLTVNTRQMFLRSRSANTLVSLLGCGKPNLVLTATTTAAPHWRCHWTSRSPTQSTSRLFSNMPNPLQVFQFDSTKASAASTGPRVFVTKGLSPLPPSEKVMETMSKHAQTLISAQLTDAHSEKTKSLESFHVLDLSRVTGKYDQWTRALPKIHPFYAVKSNPHPALLSHLLKMGAGFDCASKTEMETVLALGAHPDNIIYAHPCKAPADILAAKAMGVRRTTFDSEAELLKIKQLYPEMELVLRIWVDDSAAQCPLANKYGALKTEWQPLLSLAHVLGLNVVGVSFHVGSGGNKETFQSALRDARYIFDLAEENGHKLSLLDIGGGFPGIDVDPENNMFLQCAEVINSELANFPEGIRMIAEPGRYFCAESQTLVSMVIAKRIRNQKPAYFIGDGLYQSFNCMLYDHTKLLEPPTNEAMYPSTLFGQTCDGLDQIASDFMLPELDVGDWVAFPGMGAYTTAAASRFNGFGTPSVVIVEDHHASI
jgi:ornithine decarboxylase